MEFGTASEAVDFVDRQFRTATARGVSHWGTGGWPEWSVKFNHFINKKIETEGADSAWYYVRLYWQNTTHKLGKDKLERKPFNIRLRQLKSDIRNLTKNKTCDSK